MAEALKLPIIDLFSPDRISSADSIRQACTECGFFYVVNHGVEEELLAKLFEESSNFFSLPLEDKLRFVRKKRTGFAPLYAENLDPNPSSRGDSKETFYIGPVDDVTPSDMNQWPSEDVLPSWRPTMESYYRNAFCAGRRIMSLIALALNLDDDFFEKLGALDEHASGLRLLHYPGELKSSDQELYGASAHSDFGMLALLVTNGVPGLQVCRDKSKQPRVWEDVPHIDGAFIVNIGDLIERCTNGLFRSTLHRVVASEQERYSVAFFLDPNEDFIVECLASCCSESSPPIFPPIRSGDYVTERLKITYGSQD